MKDSRPVLDLTAALDRFDGDQELFLSLAGMFMERAAEVLPIVHTALASQDFQRVMKEAHKLKGSTLEFCAHDAVNAISRLEAAARNPTADDVAVLGERMQEEVGKLIAVLKEIREKGFSS
ncbi:MAG TPA: Hpt domain-containing protein [Nitrospira sp.]|jgi:HPt (histidine-containing phosphotransfer) domain-containing protein|nr:Hpt domain-containing protein [Nitrospira sp.]